MTGIVKIGGASGNAIEPLAGEIAKRTADGEHWIVVHGASGVMNELCAERGVEVRTVTSPSGYRSRFVGARERELFREAALSYGARVKRILSERGVRAEQADPEKAAYAVAKRKDFLRESVNGRVRILRGNYSGTVTAIDLAPLEAMLDAGVVPVVPPLALDAELSVSLNVDGDRLAARIAGEARARVLIILTNVPGLMKDINDPASLITTARLSEWELLEHYAEGSMKRKLVACKEALELSVPKVRLADGRVKDPIANALGGKATCLAR